MANKRASDLFQLAADLMIAAGLGIALWWAGVVATEDRSSHRHLWDPWFWIPLAVLLVGVAIRAVQIVRRREEVPPTPLKDRKRPTTTFADDTRVTLKGDSVVRSSADQAVGDRAMLEMHYDTRLHHDPSDPAEEGQ